MFTVLVKIHFGEGHTAAFRSKFEKKAQCMEYIKEVRAIGTLIKYTINEL